MGWTTPSTLLQLNYELPDNVLRVFETPGNRSFDDSANLRNLTLLVFGAVLQVVCVSLPGYIVARLGYFDAEKQKFLANLNVMLFTPCLIFTKLAAQLNADKLVDLAVIPVIFAIQTLVSYVIARLLARVLGFDCRAGNFVTAMSVFGNSNSLPISLVLSLSKTLSGLHWDRIPGDNDNDVAARGILYLLIFQQLGQLVRWSWGYHVLLAPKEKYDELAPEIAEEGQYHDDVDEVDNTAETPVQTEGMGNDFMSRTGTLVCIHDAHDLAGATPVHSGSTTSLVGGAELGDSSDSPKKPRNQAQAPGFEPYHDDGDDEDSLLLSFPPIVNPTSAPPRPSPTLWTHMKDAMHKKASELGQYYNRCCVAMWNRLPRPIQKWLSYLRHVWARAYELMLDFMNPPLWAMLLAVTVASIPSLQRLFFEPGTFVQTSVTSALRMTAGVAVPLILIVLGANLARNTQPGAEDGAVDPEEQRIGNKLLIASLLGRMLLPTIVMLPILAFFAKYVPVSILDDPIFVIVCFLLSGAPSALQLAQICQLNNVFMGVMANILFQSYVIWILPSTLFLVMCALQVVKWATAQ